MITPRKRFLRRVLISIYVLICSCTSSDKKNNSLILDALSDNRNYNNFECSSKLFNEVEDFIIGISDKKEFEFAKIAKKDSLINNTCYKLFYLKSNNKELIGYWGERNDSVLFVPIRSKACVLSEYLIYRRNLDGYFNLQGNSCFDDSIMASGYSYRRIVSENRFVSLVYYVNPSEVANITQAAHYFDSVPLLLNIDFRKGVTLFMYDFDLDKQPIIPWAEQLLPVEVNL